MTEINSTEKSFSFSRTHVNGKILVYTPSKCVRLDRAELKGCPKHKSEEIYQLQLLDKITLSSNVLLSLLANPL